MMMMMMMMTLMKNLLVDLVKYLESSWNLMAHSDAREGKWRGNWRMEWIASTLHATSELGVSSITTADAHTSAARSRLNWRPRRFKWTRPFSPKDEIWFLRVCHHVSYPGIWLLTPGFLQYIFLHYVLCCISQHDAQWNQQTIFTVTIHKHTNTHTHTPISFWYSALFSQFYSPIYIQPCIQKNTSQFVNSATSVQLTQFPVRSFPSLFLHSKLNSSSLHICIFVHS